MKFEISRAEQKLLSISFEKSDLKEVSFSPAYSLGATLEELVLLGGPCQFEINSITSDADLKHIRGQMLKSITRVESNSKLKE